MIFPGPAAAVDTLDCLQEAGRSVYSTTRTFLHSVHQFGQAHSFLFLGWPSGQFAFLDLIGQAGDFRSQLGSNIVLTTHIVTSASENDHISFSNI